MASLNAPSSADIERLQQELRQMVPLLDLANASSNPFYRRVPFTGHCATSSRKKTKRSLGWRRRVSAYRLRLPSSTP